jgi:hypothetical protein
MGLISFMSVPFLIAGALCATGPLIIHLLNRRRHRVVKWAAMDFLRQAMRQNRKILNIRDLILLVLRTAAVLLFGIALARPFYASHEQVSDVRQPLHAVLIVDNSLSMSYETLEGSLLDLAKRIARQTLDELPRGSRINIIPACGSRELLSPDPFESVEQALEALARIETVDRAATMSRINELASVACQAAPELAKRVILLSDQQKKNWQSVSAVTETSGQPPIQCVAVRPPDWENTWVAGVRVQDGLADIETPTTVIVEVAHQGAQPRRDLQVSLSAGDTILGQQLITVEPGAATREVSFECILGGIGKAPEPGQAAFLSLTAKITPDRLTADDQRVLSVPLVAALPVVFVDQHAGDEDVVRGRLGETRHLRKLLAPRAERENAPRQLIQIRHVSPAAISRDTLADARLVVVAGLADPGPMTPFLTEYVEQGGQLLIAAGADFDPQLWNRVGWRAGQGILPLPLKTEFIGVTPEESPDRIAPYQLSFPSLASEAIFQIAGASPTDLAALYTEPYFFKAVAVDESAETEAALATAEAQRIEAEQNIEPDETPQRWLLWGDGNDWRPTSPPQGNSLAASESRPVVLARFALPGEPAFLVSRRLGRGRVLLCTTGVLSPWNTLPKTNAVVLYDRLMREMIESTLPKRNFVPTEELTLPLPETDQHLSVSLLRPGAAVEEPLDVSFVSAQRRGVVVPGLLARGDYRIVGRRLGPAATTNIDRPTWDVSLAINGDADESDLTPLGRTEFDKNFATAGFRWVAASEANELSGSTMSGQSSWWWLALAVIVLLAIEMLVIVMPLPRRPAPSSSVAALLSGSPQAPAGRNAPRSRQSPSEVAGVT